MKNLILMKEYFLASKRDVGITGCECIKQNAKNVIIQPLSKF